RLPKSCYCLVILPFRTTRVAEQKIEVRIVRITLECLSEDYARALVTLRANIRDTKPQEVDQLSLCLLERLFVKRNRLLGELLLQQLFTDHEIDFSKDRPQFERFAPVPQRCVRVALRRCNQSETVIRLRFLRRQCRGSRHRLLRFVETIEVVERKAEIVEHFVSLRPQLVRALK